MGSAAADTGTAEPSVVQSTIDALPAPGLAKPGQLPDYVQHVVDTTLTEPLVPPKPLEEFGRHVQGTVAQFGQQVVTHLALSAKNDLGEVAAPAKLRMVAFGGRDTPPYVRPLDAPPRTAPASLLGREHVTAHDFGSQPATDSPRHGPPSDESQELPALPPLPAPLAPPTAPVSACNSCGHGSDDDLGFPVFYTWSNSRSGLATSRALRMITQYVATAAGEQPGVTPD
jgi:hypothetical protein